MKLSTLLALVALSAPLAAQTPYWEDDFNDGVLDPAWVVTFNPLQFWSTGEFGGFYNFDGLTAPFGAFNEQFILEQSITPLSGAFTFDAAMVWADSPFVSAGQSVLNTKVELLDGAGNVLVQIFLDDTSTLPNGVSMTIDAGGVAQSHTGLTDSSDMVVTVSRDGAGNVSYSTTGSAGSFSGANGTVGGDVEKVKFYTTGVSLGVGQPPLGECDIDFLTLNAGGSGPSITLNGICGQAGSSVDMAGATPNGACALVWGFTTGTSAVPVGSCAGTVLDLNNPQLATVSGADLNGNASFSQGGGVPAVACGNVTVQALDVASCATTNTLAL